MAPRRLDPEERERRRKERSRNAFSEAAYKHRYDPSREGFGSEAKWRAAAEERRTVTASAEPPSADLAVLGLQALPETLRELSRVYRRVARTRHPDAPGGSESAFVALGAAYDRLKEKFQR
jgi:hypothetical protein